MNITLPVLAELIYIAVNNDPPFPIIGLTGQYYQPYYYLMYMLARWIQTDGVIVELGVNKGYGVNSFAYGNPDISVIGLDSNIEPDYILPNVQFHLVSALPVPDFIEPNIAILHIDTEHSYDNVLNEFGQYKPYLLSGAIVLFDDLHAMDNDVLRAFNEFPYPKIQEDLLHPICGYGVMIYDD